MNATAAGLADAAERLRGRHVPGRPVVLANVWDAASARLVEKAGFPAVATSSAAVAESLGYTDHQGAPADEMFAAAARIARAVSVPVTVDAEAGYGLSAAEFVERLLATGAVGCNLEDTDHGTGELVEPARQADRLAAVRAAATDAGVPLVINARVDSFIHARQAHGDAIDESALVVDALDRARAYLAAGADCVYPILATDRAVLRLMIGELAPGAVNLLCVPGMPGGVAIREAAELGAARVSMGPALWRQHLAALGERLGVLAGE